ncbi:MAG TPA: sulfatase, partial [Opitutae bacterium]|nr:sulfatase [Opitutae bacterium]
MIPQFRSIPHPKSATIVALLGLLLTLASCSSGPGEGQSSEGQRPNIIFVMTDDHTHGQMSIAGNPLINTPNLDRLGNEGVWFKNAFCTNSICAPARATILTGT